MELVGSWCRTRTAGSHRATFVVSEWSYGIVLSGIPLDGLGAAIRNGQISLDFLDTPALS